MVIPSRAIPTGILCGADSLFMFILLIDLYLRPRKSSGASDLWAQCKAVFARKCTLQASYFRLQCRYDLFYLFRRVIVTHTACTIRKRMDSVYSSLCALFSHTHEPFRLGFSLPQCSIPPLRNFLFAPANAETAVFIYVAV